MVMASNQVYADPKFDGYYNTILTSLQSTAPQVQYQMPTQDQLASQIAAYLRPQYDQAIASRQQQTLQTRAATDVDAASRGMGASTWVTDVKNKAANAEATDIANLESNYGAQLAESLLNQYNQALANKLNVDTTNAQMRAQYEQLAYNRAADMYALTNKKSSGGGRGKTSDPEISLDAFEVAQRYKDYISNPTGAGKSKTIAQRKSELKDIISKGELEKKYPGVNTLLTDVWLS